MKRTLIVPLVTNGNSKVFEYNQFDCIILMSSLMSSKQKFLMKHDQNYIKLLKQVTHLLLSQAEQIKLFGCSLFKKVINKDDITVMLLRQSKLLSSNRPIDTFTPLPYKSNRKIKNDGKYNSR